MGAKPEVDNLEKEKTEVKAGLRQTGTSRGDAGRGRGHVVLRAWDGARDRSSLEVSEESERREARDARREERGERERRKKR